MKDLHWDHNNHIIWFCPSQTLEYDLFTVLWWFICGWTDCEMPLSNESGNYIIVSLWSKKSLLFFSPSPLQWINNEDKAVNKRRQIDRIFFSYAITRRIVLSGFFVAARVCKKSCLTLVTWQYYLEAQLDTIRELLRDPLKVSKSPS